MQKKDPKRARGRVVRVSFENNKLFKRLIIDLYDMNVFRTPDEFADEIFELGLHTKAKELTHDPL